MKSPKFRPHFNNELGKGYHTEKDMRADMKKRGVEFYDPSSVAKRETKSYERSQWAKDMLNNIHERHGRKPDGRFLDELAKRGYSQKSADKARETYMRSQNGR